MKSLEQIKAPIIVNSLAYISLTISGIILLSLFLPWRQTVTGSGYVSVFSPMQRPQTINTQIDARIDKWYVEEGHLVNKGDLILELAEVKPEYLDDRQLEKLLGQEEALEQKRTANKKIISSLKQQISSLYQFQNAAVPSANLGIAQNQDKLDASKQDYNAAEQNYKTAKLNYDRREQLFKKGLSSKRDFELAELALIKAESELNAAEAKLSIARRDVSLARLDVTQVSANTSLKIQETEAKLAGALEKLANIDKLIYDLDIKISNFENRMEQRRVIAPVDGQIVKLKAYGSGEILKAGSRLATIVPETSDRAVELYISDFFIPLVEIGRDVRLQFAGWPALQFSGSPSVAVGTFAGKVAVIDASVSDNGDFRVLVKPDLGRIESGEDEAWPIPQQLRPGMKVTGWVILDEVPVWYELWRILNGFAPSVMKTPKKHGGRKVKPK